jgi:hypothetical protein
MEIPSRSCRGLAPAGETLSIALRAANARPAANVISYPIAEFIINPLIGEA